MISALKIHNFAIADDLNIEFQQGLTTITGETGAGKSIMIDALALALGERADTSMVGSHGDKAQIIAEFDLSKSPESSQWLKEKCLDADGECILRRVISKDGKSRAFINGTPSPLQDIKALAEHLINIHSQHQHQLLLKKENHRQLLDAYCENQSLLEQVSTAFQQWQTAKQKLDELESNQSTRLSRIEFLSFQLQEFENLNLSENEYQNLNEEHQKLANIDQDLVQANQAIDLLNSSESDDNIISSLNKVLNTVQNLSQKHLSLRPTFETLESARIQIEESTRDIQHCFDNLENNPERLSEVDQRLSNIHHLARKHHTQAEQLYTFQQKLSEELSQLKNADVSLEHLHKQCEKFQSQYCKLANELSKKRRKSAKQLDQAINARFTELGMEHARIVSSFDKLELESAKKHGLDKIEWLISTNPGQEAQPLNKIASGGELSRISLAIQVNFAEKTHIPCLIFDEVDVGIGGATGDIVGKLLRELATHSQIICVTHLAQVAAQGHQHLLIEKQKNKNSVKTLITSLNEKQRISEIARMMGGSELTQKSQSHAKEMLAIAQAS